MANHLRMNLPFDYMDYYIRTLLPGPAEKFFFVPIDRNLYPPEWYMNPDPKKGNLVLQKGTVVTATLTPTHSSSTPVYDTIVTPRRRGRGVHLHGVRIRPAGILSSSSFLVPFDIYQVHNRTDSVPWQSFRRLWNCNEYNHAGIEPGQFSLIPISDIGTVLNFLASRIKPGDFIMPKLLMWPQFLQNLPDHQQACKSLERVGLTVAFLPSCSSL